MAKEKHSSKLLVEGKNDQHVFWAMCEIHGVQESFDIVDCEGIGNLKDQIPVRIKQQGINTIGIVVDADQNSENVWNSLKIMLEEFGYVLPDGPEYGGYVHAAQQIYPKVGIWIMPENTSAGMLEDFAKNLIPDSDLLKLYVEGVLQELEHQQLNRYSMTHKAKAYIHTFLAWQEDPGTPLGLSITKHYLDHNAAAGISLVEWLKLLYN